MNLYRIAQNVRALLETVSSIPETEDEIADQQRAQEAFDKLEMPARDLLYSVVGLAREMQVEREARDKIIERMQRLNSNGYKQEQALLSMAQTLLEGAALKVPVIFDEFQVGLAKQPQTAIITSEAALPLEFLTVVPAVPESTRVDKNRLNKAVRAGEVIPGAELSPQTYRLAIKE